MKQMIERALSETREMWEPLRRAYRWVWAAAQVLANAEQKQVEEVRAAFARVLRSIGVTRGHCGAVEQALRHFLKVTRRYRSGLFHCYEDAAIPRTNNELEQCFGQHRHHERRASRRKKRSLNMVLHGTVRLVAGVATRLRQFGVAELAPRSYERWQELQKAIRQRFALRAQGRRFRRNPDAYLAQLEDTYFKPALPV